MQGRILSRSAGIYRVKTDDGIYSCTARGTFRKDGIVPIAGDYVEISCEDDNFGGVIERVLDRRNSLIRPEVANIDTLFIVFALKDPDLSLYLIDKLCALAEHNSIAVHIIFNKRDLVSEEECEKAASVYRACSYPVHIFSALGKESVREELAGITAGSTCVFAGPSGVGKSTLINVLYPELQGVETGSVSEKTRRGRHTTRMTSLYPAENGGYLVDTPGFSLLDFDRFRFMKKEELAGAFPEFAPYLHSCRYKKCTHLREEGCAVIEKVADGTIPPSRHESYKALWEELKNHHDWDEKKQKNY